MIRPIIYMVMMLVTLGLFAYSKFTAKTTEDRFNTLELQNWFIFFLLMSELIRMGQ